MANLNLLRTASGDTKIYGVYENIEQTANGGGIYYFEVDVEFPINSRIINHPHMSRVIMFPYLFYFYGSLWLFKKVKISN